MEFRTIQAHAPGLVGILLLGVGLLGSLAAIQFPNPYSKAVAVSLLIGAPIGLLLLTKERPEMPVQTPSSLRGLKVLALSYTLTVTALFFFYTPGQSRSLAVHSTQIVLYFLCLVSIVLVANRMVSLGLLILTALIHRLTVYWASSIQIGLDALYHSRALGNIANAGSISPVLTGSTYYYAPLQHIYGAIGQLVFASNSRTAGMVILLSIVIMGTLGAYILTARFTSALAGLFAAYLFGISDYMTHWAVQVTPTTLGVALSVLTLLSLILAIDRPTVWTSIVLILAFITQALTHQMSLFATTIVTLSYLGGRTIYRTPTPIERERTIRVGSIITFILLADWMIVRRYGPRGENPPFLVEMISNLIAQIRVATPYGEMIKPEAGLAIAGTSGLSMIHVTGFILLFILGIVGAIQALRLNRYYAAHFVGIGMIVASVGMILFPAPALGVGFFLPNRWYLYFYLPLAIFGGVALAYTVQLVVTRIDLPQRQTMVIILVIGVLLIPSTALMVLNYPGATDGPVVGDDAPAAYKLTTTAQEDALYRHTAEYGGGTLTLADHVSRQVVERYYGYPTEYYTVDDQTGEPTHEETALIVDRAYTQTDHSSYQVRTNRVSRVFGPLPIDRENTAVVYDTGNENTLRYDTNNQDTNQ